VGVKSWGVESDEFDLVFKGSSGIIFGASCGSSDVFDSWFLLEMSDWGSFFDCGVDISLFLVDSEFSFSFGPEY